MNNVPFSVLLALVILGSLLVTLAAVRLGKRLAFYAAVVAVVGVLALLAVALISQSKAQTEMAQAMQVQAAERAVSTTVGAAGQMIFALVACVGSVVALGALAVTGMVLWDRHKKREQQARFLQLVQMEQQQLSRPRRQGLPPGAYPAAYPMPLQYSYPPVFREQGVQWGVVDE